MWKVIQHSGIFVLGSLNDAFYSYELVCIYYRMLCTFHGLCGWAEQLVEI